MEGNINFLKGSSYGRLKRFILFCSKNSIAIKKQIQAQYKKELLIRVALMRRGHLVRVLSSYSGSIRAEEECIPFISTVGYFYNE